MNRLSMFLAGALALVSACVVVDAPPPNYNTNTVATGTDPNKPDAYNNQNQPAPVNTGGKTNATFPRVIFLIPEYHVSRTSRVETPSAETEFTKAFVTYGYKVLDKKQSEKAWKDEVLYKLEKEEDITAAAALAFKSGAEILIVGEAFSEKGTTFNTGGGNLFSCAGRVDVKVVKASTGQILYADSATGKGADTAEVIAGKKAVESAAALLAERAAVQVQKVWNNDTVGGGKTIEVIVSIPNQNLTFGEADGFRKAAVKAIPGVKEIVMREFIEGAAPYEFVYEGDAQGLASAINDQTINGRKCTVTKVQEGKIFVNLK
jgi:hypothetical protein